MVGRRIVFSGLFGLALACVSSNRVTVHEGRIGDKTSRELGLDLDVTHVPTTGFTGQKAGYYVVRSPDDWLLLWSESRPDHAKNPPPPAMDFKTQMAIVATSADADAMSWEIERVIKEGRTLHVYVNEEEPGRQCKVNNANKAPLMDVVLVESSDLDVVMHVDRSEADSCGPGPDVAVACKVSGATGAGETKVTAMTGQAIECDNTKATSASGVVTERNWTLDSRPPGSFTSLSVNGAHAKLTVDAWGSYAVRFEAVDDQEKRGEATVMIDVPPPYDGNAVQLAWTKYDPKDDPTTFPRFELHVVEVPFRVGTPNKDCTEEAPKPWCQIKTSAFVKQIDVKPAAKTRYKMVVKYIDDRFQGAPVLCFRTFLPGPSGGPAKTVDTCDDNVRKAGTVWEPGALDTESGGFEDPTKPHVPPPPPPAPDAGAPAPAAADAGK